MTNWEFIVVLAWIGCAALSVISQRVIQAFDLAASVRSPTRIDQIASGFAKTVWITASILAGGGAVLGILWLFFLISVFAARSMCGAESRLLFISALVASAVLSAAGLKWAMPRLPMIGSGLASPVFAAVAVWLVALLGLLFVLSGSFGMVMFAASSWNACN